MQKAAAATLSRWGTRQQLAGNGEGSHKQPSGFPARMTTSKRRQRQHQLRQWGTESARATRATRIDSDNYVGVSGK